jgi:signal transduction histidine kinase
MSVITSVLLLCTPVILALATGGTGLGLKIARKIAARHGARLDVQSEVGRGSVLTVRFPRAG